MKCPVCGKEMEAGYFQTGPRAAWVKAPHKISLLPKEGEVLLGNRTFRGLCLAAHLCKACKKVLLDYSKADENEG